ncbi:Hsp70 family protein [Prochlorococcus sp. MIT 0601]|uniref:Hsp70 family protein n=2 Tax=Prochlorococcus TaxID=1218 RepID=UPI00068F952C|nr:Hsp70 family protein [Prochlorococcus sp. MIT 0601]
MALENNQSLSSIESTSRERGTLAIDLGSSTTVVAFQGKNDQAIKLVDLNPISRIPGEVPTLIWMSPKIEKQVLFGHQLQQVSIHEKINPYFICDFKRWIGAPIKPNNWNCHLLPEEAGELFLKEIWSRIPNQFDIERLVLTAPIETYKNYRKWLYKVCRQLKVKEIALVDEPTAAAIGAGQTGGAKLLVMDIGGSTIDISMVLLEGGEGYSEPIAQLLRFDGKDLGEESKQVLRCAKVIGKAGVRLGGRDLDRWITNHLHPDCQNNEIFLNAAEILKCKLSDESLSDTKTITEKVMLSEQDDCKEMSLSRVELEDLIISKGLLKVLDNVLEKTLAKGRSNGCELEDLSGVIIVGGGAKMPLIKRWFQKKILPAQLLTPPPIEAVAIGALSLTPGVSIKDILTKGVCLRCWEQKSKKHIWHPLFLPGQPWPTSKPLEIILASSKENQEEIELRIADYDSDGSNEIVYINGMPTIKETSSEVSQVPWESTPLLIQLRSPINSGEDCIKLNFSIDYNCNLLVEVIDIKDGELIVKENLGVLR